MVDILKRIETMRKKRGWSEYELSKKTDIPQSTISSWYRKDQIPALHSLEKICKAFDLPLSVMVAETDHLTQLSPEDHQILNLFQCMNSQQKTSLLQLLKSFSEIY